MPREVHEHFTVDPDNPDGPGIPTGYTIVTRESPWDDDTRARAIALTEREDSICKCGCGRPIAETLQKDQAYRVHVVRCAAGRAIDQVRRLDRDKHKNDPSWDDGLHYRAEPVELPDRTADDDD